MQSRGQTSQTDLPHCFWAGETQAIYLKWTRISYVPNASTLLWIQWSVWTASTSFVRFVHRKLIIAVMKSIAARGSLISLAKFTSSTKRSWTLWNSTVPISSLDVKRISTMTSSITTFKTSVMPGFRVLISVRNQSSSFPQNYRSILTNVPRNAFLVLSASKLNSEWKFRTILKLIVKKA